MEDFPSIQNLANNDEPKNPSSGKGLEAEDWVAGRQEHLILLTLSIISFVVALDATVFAPALPAIADDLNGTTIEAFWAGTSYLLANTTFQPFIAAISDIFGRRDLLLLSIGFFTLGSVICCIARNFTTLLAGRSIQGIGGGGIMTMALVILTDIYPLRQRAKYTSFLQIAWALGTIFGPFIGGLVAQETTWRLIFYLNFPFCAIGFFMVIYTVTLKIERTTLVQKLSKVDWFGGILFTAGCSTFLVGLSWGGTQYPWSSYQTWVPIVIGGLLIIATLLWEKLVPAQPFLRLSIFNNVSTSVTFFGAMTQGFLLFTHLYFGPLYAESVKGISYTIAGVLIMGVNISFFPVAAATGIYITRKGDFLWAVWTGWVVVIFGNGLLLHLQPSLSITASFFILLVTGFGQGFLVSALGPAVQSSVRTKDVAFAVSMFSFIRTFGMCLGVVIGSTTFQNSMLSELIRRGLQPELAANAVGFVPRLRAMASGKLKDDLIASYAAGFHGTWYALLAFAAAAGALSLGTRRYSMDKKLDSTHTLKRKPQAEVSTA